ncbi:hypothetical protein HAX54_017271, partial [Datura stramonium]|nr:hypothetical protein [Datura stramonium]
RRPYPLLFPSPSPPHCSGKRHRRTPHLLFLSPHADLTSSLLRQRTTSPHPLFSSPRRKPPLTPANNSSTRPTETTNQPPNSHHAFLFLSPLRRPTPTALPPSRLHPSR